MRRTTLALAAAAIASCPAAGTAAPRTTPQTAPQAALRPELPRHDPPESPEQLVSVTILLRAPAEPFDLDALRALDKAHRREFVLRTLEDHARRSQRGVLADLAEAERAGAAADIRPLWIADAVSASVSPETARRLAARTDVAGILPDVPSGRAVLPSVPQGGPDDGRSPGRGIDCGVQLIHAPDAWAAGYTGEGVIVGVIDTGLCLTHPDIAGQVWTNPGEITGNGVDDDGNGFTDDVYGWNFDAGSSDVHDTVGHGSHVAGTVAGDGTQGTQCGTAPDAQIMTLVFRNDIAGESTVWGAIEYGVANNADVLSISLGWLHAWNPQRAVWRQICENAMAAGVIVVSMAGGDGNAYGIDSVRTPGDVPDMITVGTTDCSMNLASFSSRGPVTWQDVNPYNDWPYPPGKIKPTVAAPGVNTVSHDLCDGYTFYSGSAMAVPHVSGTVALMLQANPDLDHYQIKQILKDTAIDRGQQGPDNDYGHGLIDAWAAVQAALDMACRADFNGDGAVNTLDMLAFLNAWAAGSSDADINGDGAVNTLDVLAFLNLWNLGC